MFSWRHCPVDSGALLREGLMPDAETPVTPAHTEGSGLDSDIRWKFWQHD